MTMTTSIIAERTHWAARISAAWQHSVDSIIETGRLLLGAKADPAMQHGEWGTMVESDLPFNRHTAHKLMQIASDKRLTNVSHGKHLPPSWTTLYELTKLDDETFDQKLRDGTIHPDMQRKEASKNRIFSRERGRRRVELGDIEDVFGGIEPDPHLSERECKPALHTESIPRGKKSAPAAMQLAEMVKKKDASIFARSRRSHPGAVRGGNRVDGEDRRLHARERKRRHSPRPPRM
jgi:hypothetical protein